MRKKAAAIFCVVLIFVVAGRAWAQVAGKPNSTSPAGSTDVVGARVELARHENEASAARLEPARMDGKPGVAVIFEGTDDLHYYAKPETAPAAGFELKVEAKSDDFGFGKAVFPKWGIFVDSLGNKVEVYAGRFTVFVPIKTVRAPTKTTVIEEGDIEVKISGIACTSMICLPPFEKTLRAKIDITHDSLKDISFETASDTGRPAAGPGYSAWFALGLALLAGLSLNIMPCVWPVLPLIVMRIVEQAKQGRRQSAALGLAFCLGILLFFACLAGANIILQLFYGTVLQWGDQFRSPAFVAGMALLLVVLALFMFGLFTITVPSSIAGKSGSGKGYSGAVGMGLLAAVLSTPCSFAILAAAFAWAQLQPLPLGTFAIMVIGIGMAAPYAILTSIPALLNRLPKAGRWMELFKQAVGFLLLLIAVKLIAALPEVRRIGVLYFAVVLAFCVWMWSGWVTYNTKPSRKWFARIIAVVLAVTAGWAFLPAPAEELIQWQKYDAAAIETANAEARPVLIKFTADWCWNCGVVEKVVYRRKDIAGLIEQKNVLAIKADTTLADYPAAIALKNKYKEPGVPVTILHIPGEGEPVRLHKIFFTKKLKQLLEKLPSKQ
ncbi:MAG TPA: cytochrome c biogenesis protein CcdA [Sedimentisphaerales bacterium]|nr:cytochrome c biogenesis protein CcdA [Sedimentisphaerales bacterium]